MIALKSMIPLQSGPVQLTHAISTYVNYDGQLGREHYDSNAVTGGVRISF
jgi:hypothetical protein